MSAQEGQGGHAAEIIGGPSLTHLRHKLDSNCAVQRSPA
jgi:hypothetical protein